MINQWQLIMIISTTIHNIPDKVWTYYFVSVKLHPLHQTNFPNWIKKISPAVNMGETSYFQNREGSYYDEMPYVWKNRTVPFQREVMRIIYCFVEEDHTSKSPWNFFVSHSFFSLDEIPKIKILHMVAKYHPEAIEGRQRLITVDFPDY